MIGTAAAGIINKHIHLRLSSRHRCGGGVDARRLRQVKGDDAALKRMNAATPAKAAIASWSRALSIQVAAEGITVNCIARGPINSEQVLNRLFPTEEARRREIELNVPAGRFGEPEELAAVVTFLASTKASYVTGTMIPVDGGFLRLDLK